MNRTSIAVAVLSFALPISGLGQSNTQTASLSTPLSAHQVNSLIRSAHSTAEYRQLASYFHQQEAQYRADAAAEKVERDRRSQVNAGLMQKYPRPVDSAQYLYDSYVSKADNAALQARHFEQLASASAGQNPQNAADSQGRL